MRKMLFFAIFLCNFFLMADIIDESDGEEYLYNDVKIGDAFLKHNTPIERIRFLKELVENLSKLNQNSPFEGAADELGDAFKNENGKYKLNCNYELLKRLLLCEDYFVVKEVVESKKVFLSECGIEQIIKSSSVLTEKIQRLYTNELWQVLKELGSLNNFLRTCATEICLDYARQWCNLEYIIKDLSQLYDELLELRLRYENAIKKQNVKGRNALINHIAEKEKAMMDYLVKKEKKLKITRERLTRKTEKNKKKLKEKERKEKRTAIYRSDALKDVRKKAENRYLKTISKESTVGTERLSILSTLKYDDFVEEKRRKSEEEKLEKIERERIKIRKELNCRIKELRHDKRLITEENLVQQWDVIRNKTISAKQQNVESGGHNRRCSVIARQKVLNGIFFPKAIDIETNSRSNVLNKDNGVSNSKNNLRYIGMRNTSVDGKIILPEEYIKLPLLIQNEYIVYEE